MSWSVAMVLAQAITNTQRVPNAGILLAVGIAPSVANSAVSNSPQIDWDPVTGATFYNVYKASTSGGLASAAVYAPISADTTTYIDPVPGTGAQFYAITSVGPGGAESAQSAPIARFF